eukprot:10019322-Karenia_brevis.AAC.1
MARAASTYNSPGQQALMEKMMRPLPLIMAQFAADPTSHLDVVQEAVFFITLVCLALDMHISQLRCRLLTAALMAAFCDHNTPNHIFYI